MLKFERAGGPDPAYAELPRAAALRFGPHLLSAGEVHLQAELSAQQRRLSMLAAHGRREVLDELRVVVEALAFLPDALTSAP